MARSEEEDLEAKPFLQEKRESSVTVCEACQYGTDETQRWTKPERRSAMSFRACLVHLLFITLYTVVCIAVALRYSHRFTLLNETIRGLELHVKTTPYVVAGQSPYAGGPKADPAWHELLANITVRVSDEELARNGDRTESVRLPDGGGSMAWIGVFHQLHCLKKLRQLNYPKIYAPSLTEDERWEQEVHINHCVELLRQSIMCNPDTYLTTFGWSKTKTKPVLVIGGFERQCVDWERFMTGILPRVVGEEEINALQNPNLVDPA